MEAFAQSEGFHCHRKTTITWYTMYLVRCLLNNINQYMSLVRHQQRREGSFSAKH